MKKVQFYGQIRAIAMAVAGLLAHRGVITQSETELVVAIIVGVAMMAWSWIEKRDTAPAPAELVRKTGVLVLAIAIAACLSGCGTVKPVDTNAWAKDYYAQPNTAQIACIEGPNVEFSIKGATKITLNTPVPPKTIIPRDPGVLDSLSGFVGNALPWVGAMYVGGKLAGRPATVQQQVVRPEVITVPAQ